MIAVELLLLAAPVAPLGVALAAMATPARADAPRVALALALALAALPGLLAGLSLAVATAPVRVATPGFLFGAQLGLEPALGAPMAAVALVWALAALHGAARDPASDGSRTRRYAVCFGFAMAGQMATFVARDIASFYVGFAALSFAGYGLVAHYAHAAAARAARIYIAFVVLGELALFAALALISSAQGGGLATPVGVAAPASAAVWWLLAIGFGVKAGLVPLHGWLPLAHPVAPVPASAALSGATLKAGLVGLMLFAPAAQAPPGFGATLLALGLTGGFGGALMATLQRDAKTALAWSSVSQMGLALALWGAAADGRAAPDAAAAALGLFIVHHALAKASLFLAVDPGVPRRVGLVLAALPALSLTGAPLTLGYAAKSAVDAALEPGPVATLFATAAFATALAMGRTLWLLSSKPAQPSSPRAVAVAAAVGALLAAPFLLGVGATPQDAASAMLATAPALTCVVIAVALARAGARAPDWAAADPMLYAAPLGAAARFVATTFVSFVGAIDAARGAAVNALRGVAMRFAEEPTEESEEVVWLVAAVGALVAFTAFALVA